VSSAATSGGDGASEGARPRPSDRRSLTVLYGILGIIYVVLLVTLGIVSLRKGHWIMFIIGIFIPLFWLIGAIIPARDR
jgi:hypothetical protein